MKLECNYPLECPACTIQSVKTLFAALDKVEEFNVKSEPCESLMPNDAFAESETASALCKKTNEIELRDAAHELEYGLQKLNMYVPTVLESGKPVTTKTIMLAVKAYVLEDGMSAKTQMDTIICGLNRLFPEDNYQTVLARRYILSSEPAAASETRGQAL